jgi:hypothetical protein
MNADLVRDETNADHGEESDKPLANPNARNCASALHESTTMHPAGVVVSYSIIVDSSLESELNPYLRRQHH